MAVADGLPEAQQTIDATGLHVLPGLIDPHVYFRVPGLVYKGDFDSSSQAAAAGGITTIIDMPNVDLRILELDLRQSRVSMGMGPYVDPCFSHLPNFVPSHHRQSWNRPMLIRPRVSISSKRCCNENCRGKSEVFE